MAAEIASLESRSPFPTSLSASDRGSSTSHPASRERQQNNLRSLAGSVVLLASACCSQPLQLDARVALTACDTYRGCHLVRFVRAGGDGDTVQSVKTCQAFQSYRKGRLHGRTQSVDIRISDVSNTDSGDVLELTD